MSNIRPGAIAMANSFGFNMHMPCVTLVVVTILLTSHEALLKISGVAGTTLGAVCGGNTFGTMKPTATLTMPMELVVPLGNMQAAVAATFITHKSATGHGVARANMQLPGYTTFTSRTCRAAGLVCNELYTVAPYTNANHAFVAQSQLTARTPHIDTINDMQMDFFLESSLQLGSKVSLNMNLRSLFPSRRFLPKNISESLPALKTENLANLLNTFRIREGTPLASTIATAAHLCGSPALPGEERACHTSFEGMAQFATSKLGADNVRILATTGAPTEASNSSITVTGIHKRSIVEGKHVVVCHDLFFPSALEYCHLVAGAKIVQVSLETESVSKNQIHAVAICHLDTTVWLSRHPAFAALNIEKGAEACHFLSEGDIVWVANSIASDV